MPGVSKQQATTLPQILIQLPRKSHDLQSGIESAPLDYARYGVLRYISCPRQAAHERFRLLEPNSVRPDTAVLQRSIQIRAKS